MQDPVSKVVMAVGRSIGAAGKKKDGDISHGITMDITICKPCVICMHPTCSFSYQLFLINLSNSFIYLIHTCGKFMMGAHSYSVGSSHPIYIFPEPPSMTRSL
jgi:hypothetical protein